MNLTRAANLQDLQQKKWDDSSSKELMKHNKWQLKSIYINDIHAWPAEPVLFNSVISPRLC